MIVQIKLAEKIWDYMRLNQPLKKSDIIWVLCSNHLCVAECVAELYFQGFGSKIIYSGGVAHKDDLLNTGWDKPEAEVFAEIGIKSGIPKDAILIENKATNTGENIKYTYKLIMENGLNIKSALLVQKPFMERRVYATLLKQWPGEMIDFSITSPQLTMNDYISSEKINVDDLINLMVGDLQRIKEYPDKGFQVPQEIPNDVWEAWEELVDMGYTKHLIK